MLAPQSDAELAPILDDLRRLDPLLDLRWNPQAVIVEKGSYSAEGKRTDPIYDGRWQIIRSDDPNVGHAGFHPERGFTVICTLTEWSRVNGVIQMVSLRDGGAYVPVGDWVVEMMRQSDAQNMATLTEVRRRLWAESDRVERNEGALDEAMAMAGLDRVHFKANYAGGVGNWQGKGADFAEMAQAATSRQSVRRILTASR